MLKNKNGGFVMSWVVTVFTMFFLLLVFFIFFFLIDLDKNKITQEIQTETQENQIHINLLNFLRTPVNEEENVGDYVGYALIEDDGIEGDYDGHLNSHYNYVINLFNQILLNHYKNAFEESSQAKDNLDVGLKMELINPSGEVIKYREIYSCFDIYSSSVIIPLKEPGYRLNITLLEGGAIEKIFFELKKNDNDEWECQPYYTSSDINPALYGDIIYDTFEECNQKKEEYTKEGTDTEEEALQKQYEDKIKENEEKYDFPLVALCKISEYYIVEDGYKYCSCFIYNEAPFMELCGSGDSTTIVQVLDIFDSEEKCVAAGKKHSECQEHEMGYTETRT